MLLLAGADTVAQPPVIVVDRDDVRITRTCRVRFGTEPIKDTDGDGVVQIETDGVTVTFEGTLRGAAEGQLPDTYHGVGIRVMANDVMLRSPRVSGFKTGIHATRATGLFIDNADVSDNFRQRLRSGPESEDPADWLKPHANDNNEWLTSYGAGVYVEDSNRVIVRRTRAWATQNGIILDRVGGSRIYDNDCSFGSGWGIALWRSSDNIISRNACDFRVRGYRHGVYNRGQDSAGILMFEQCARNTITSNSATHCGDGFFGFAGSEAIGEANPRPAIDWYVRRGNERNEITENDFSYAAAHGLELTFSFRNRILGNRLVGNAICGIWGGYSRHTFIGFNTIEANGDMPYGTERGGVNIEHGSNNNIYGNTFRNNPVGVFLWWDRDERIANLPWAQANGTAVEENRIMANVFEGDKIAIQLREIGTLTLAANAMIGVGAEVDADELSETVITRMGNITRASTPPELPESIGDNTPVGARAELQGREHIVMTEWGPYDWQRPLLTRRDSSPGRHVYELLGPELLAEATLAADDGVTLTRDGARLTVTTTQESVVLGYTLTARTGGASLEARGTLVPAQWKVRVFPSAVDPREDAEAWREQGKRDGLECTLDALHLPYGRGGPSGLDLDEKITLANLPADGFGTIATTTLEFPAGRWRLRTTSDDGIRLWLGEALVIDDWKWHPPKVHTYELELAEPATLPIRVEHFELDGLAVLALDIEPVN